MKEETIGAFIQKVRKEKGLTQKELAERIHVSDKTISKWENGNSAPNTEILSELCLALDISVNELLSGERILPEVYSKKAEENMMLLLKDQERQKKAGVWSMVLGIILGLLAVVMLILSSCITNGKVLLWFVDLPSLLGLVLICSAVVLISGVRGKLEILRIIQKALIPAGLFMSLFCITLICGMYGDTTLIGPMLVIALLSVLYAVLGYLILIPVIKRLENK